MRHAFWLLALLIGASAVAQQQAPPPATPPTFPQGQVQHRMPPETKAPAPEKLSTEVQQQIQGKLSSEPSLTNTNVRVKADDSSVTLTGTVDGAQQRDFAQRIARSYAGNRKIVNKIEVGGKK